MTDAASPEPIDAVVLPERKQAWFFAAAGTALVAGLFSLFVCTLMIVSALRSRAADLRTADELASLKLQLGTAPRDEALKQRIRTVDLRLRTDYFRREHRTRLGTPLLVAGIVVMLIALKSAAALRKHPPMPQAAAPAQGADARAARTARWAVAASGATLVVAAALLVLTSRSAFTEQAPAQSTRGNWPRFRGPGGLGICTYKDIPTSWNGTTGENILWKTPVPTSAPNSPVVWGNRVFLTGSEKARRDVYCFDTETGALLWQKPTGPIPGSPAKMPEVMEGVGLAAATAATDGRRVYAIFATGDVVAFNFIGKRVWARNLGVPDNSYGHASSLAIWRDRLLVLYDQATAEDELSRLIALDSATGKTVWETQRDTPQTWATPIVYPTPKGDQIACSGDPWLAGYDAATGKELWKADCMGGEIAPSPVFANGLVFAANSGAYAVAVRPDGQGEVTKTHILWQGEDGLPDICSPLTNGEFFFLLTADGLLTCYDAADGKLLWDKEFEVNCQASPSVVGDRVLVPTDKGVTISVKAAREFAELGRCELGEKSRTCPAFQEGRIYIRGEKHLFCIAQKAPSIAAK